MATRPTLFLLATALLCMPLTVEGQQSAGSQGTPTSSQTTAPTTSQATSTSPKSTLDDTLEAGDDEVGRPPRKLITWNEYDGPLFTMAIGGGFLYEYAAYAQNQNSKEQFALHPQAKTRDLRILLRGGLKTDRQTTWSVGIMRDFVTNDWTFRQTGFLVDVPEISGQIFIGRQKEGFSLNKIMVGYAGWTMERTEISDAAIPILADGVKWIGSLPEKHILWNLGFFGDILSKTESFSTYAHQTVGRFVFLPVESEETVLHFGINLRYGKPAEGMLQLRSRPEAFEAPFFVDTGLFPARRTTTTDVEAYYRPGPLLVGSEYYVQWADAPEVGDPVFNGGNVFVTWLATGETRVYNTRGGFFEQVSPARTLFEGGPGAWELVTNFSYIDLDSGSLQGGKLWRLTPMVNWYVSDNVRLEMAYGYASLDRFGLVGKTQFFQTRLQLQL
jgi:phosphate-selective porin OprO and OprP